MEINASVIDWLGVHFLPFEAELRRLLYRVCRGPADVDDVIQETYYKVLTMQSLAHVQTPRAFLTQIAKNIVTDRIRREAIVSIEALGALEELGIEDPSPSPERVVMGRAELDWVLGLISNLPDRCSKVFKARRIHGLSQIETAEFLGITVGLVEYETTRGMNLMLAMVAGNQPTGESSTARSQRSARNAKKKNADN